ncbi:acetate/propionate family kinase [Bradyrhizobium sp. dw_78]|uniref:acetate/propionate family kinase n=1 Tax=Bradyrhizobium sp. dw_78 TaxID=2719793 RepID=UPI0032098FCA
MTQAILTLNAGSSSIKFSLFEIGAGDTMTLVSKGEVESIGSAPHFIARDMQGKILAERRWAKADEDFGPLLEEMIAWIEKDLGGDTLMAVGHRIVHGGPDHDRPERVTPDLLKLLERLTPLAPLHEPHSLAPIYAIGKIRPQLPQVACYDTAFHHALPKVATRFALPREFEAEGVRRYGFHGLSYEYISRQLRKLAPDLANGKVIAAHLGNGASLCAMQGGRSIDTTMGFTALDGLMMGTRCGSLDPGVVLYLEQEKKMTAKQVEDLLYRKSGLLGVSGGLASDMRTLLASQDVHAREALELFVYRIAREVGALTSSLGGLDGIVFTAGIGEHAPPIRAWVCERLRWLGVILDEKANADGADVISSPQSRIAVRVIPTDEEAMIARHTLDIVRGVSPA